MREILMVEWNRNNPFDSKHHIFKPKKQTQIENLLRFLWEREYNRWYEPIKEISYIEDYYAVVADDHRRTEFFVMDTIDMEV